MSESEASVIFSILSQLLPNFLGNKKTLKPHSFKVFSLYGGDEEDRTLYLLNAIQALSQVSYAPITDVIVSQKKHVYK